MAKRIVQECDLTKGEYDPTETVTLIIKKNGKKTGRTYELSPSAAAKLEQQLVSGNKLPEEWSFGGGRPQRDESAKRVTIGDLDTNLPRSDDANFVASKRQALLEEGGDLEPREKPEDVPGLLQAIAVDGSGCLHMNKGAIQVTRGTNGERIPYRLCRECRKRIPEKPKDDRSSFMNTKAPADTRVNHDSRVNEREN